MIHNSICRLDLMADLRRTTSVEACISDVRAWLIYNTLLINDSKTEFLVVGYSHQLSKIAIDSITVDDSTIQPLDSVRNLGSWFDSKMSISIHISKICSKAFHGLYQIRQEGVLKIPRTNLKTFGDRVFARSGPFLWNKLPLEIRNSQIVAIFKSKFKTYLFKLVLTF